MMFYNLLFKDLFSKYLGGNTQNQSDSFNSIVCKPADKMDFKSALTIRRFSSGKLQCWLGGWLF